LDLSSIIVIAALCFGAVVGEATLFGDPMQVQILVPPKVAQAGFTESTAEQLFAARVGDVGEAVSMIPTPGVQMSTRPTVLSILGKPLDLGQVVVALQGRLGIDVVTVNGAVLAADTGKQLDLVMVITIPHETPKSLQLTQADGNAVALIQQGAESALEWISPYRLALGYFTRGISGDKTALAHAKDIATSALARPWKPPQVPKEASQPWDTARATERMMLYNMLAMLALLDGDMTQVDTQLALADAIPGALPSAYGAIALNRAFLDVAMRRPEEASYNYERGKSEMDTDLLQGMGSILDTLGGLVAWSGGDLAKAERLLRAAIDTSPDAAPPHVYLAQLLAAKGDTAGAAVQRHDAATLGVFGVEIPDQPLALFWVDPAHGGLQRRSS
jgi:hypothetical protein